MREVRERLAATQVEYISGKVFFTTCSDLNMLKQLKSAERLFLLIKKQLPFPVSSVSKGGRKSNWNCSYETVWMESRFEESKFGDFYTSK